MTRCTLPSAEVAYESSRRVESTSVTGVAFTVRRISLGRRIALTKAIREVGRRLEFLEAGQSIEERVEAQLVRAEIDRVYLEWGIAAVEGFAIDGEPATVASLIEKGPEALVREMVAAIQRECGLTQDERKN